MWRSLVVSSLFVVVGCGGGDNNGNPDGNPDPDTPPSQACLDAEGYQDIQNIETKIFQASCTFSGCHNGGATDAGRLDLRSGMAHASLVDVDAEVATGRKLVVAGNPNASYLMLMIGHVAPAEADPPGELPPASIGLMPQNAGGKLLCTEKREAIERWIMAGALP